MIETPCLCLIDLSRAQLHLALFDPSSLAEQLNVAVDPAIFSEETRQAMSIKSSRMALVDASLHIWYTYFLIMRKADQVAMGVCGFKGAPNVSSEVELGYSIHSTYRNQGYMSEAVGGLIAWAFAHSECNRVVAETLPDNFSSQHVLQKNGLMLSRKTDKMWFWYVDKPAILKGMS